MKSDLNYPYSFEERRPVLDKGIFFVPDHYGAHAEFSFPSWSQIFQNDHKVHLEYCSGNGSWLIERAMRYPEINFVAVEKRFDRVRQIYRKGVNRSLANLFIISGEGLTFATHYLLEHSLDKVYINFPDPWPKKRHAKHRLMQHPFLDELKRTLVSSGEVVFVTDDATYSESTIALFKEHPGFSPFYPTPHFVTDYQNYGTSYFDALWRSLNRHIRFHVFVRAPH